MSATPLTRQPRNLNETGLPEALLKDLLLKHLFDGVVLDLTQLRDRLKLAGAIIEPIVQNLKQSQRIHTLSPKEGGSGVRYQLTELGLADATVALSRSGYVGPAPITLEHYKKLVSEQSVFIDTLTYRQIHEAFRDVVLDQRHLDVMGPALFSGKPILVYGQAGTGKTYICKKMAGLLGGAIHIPYAIAIDHEIVQYFDPLIHDPLPVESADATLAFEAAIDPRLLHCQRPVAISGGELTMDRLELNYDPNTRISYAPLQTKANNGIYIIDDMGRQRMPPVELFNRWIVPMEERVDFLVLNTGKHFTIPFDCILIFSTNLHPSELADEAFLRRLGYKIHFMPIIESQFVQIWQDLAAQRNIEVESGVLDNLFARYRQTGRDILPCHPRDLMDIALDIGAYLDNKGIVTQQNTALAWDTYFVNL